MSQRTVKLAAIQMQCEAGLIEQNLAHATLLVEQAASQGAEIVVLPELAPGGYMLTEAIWDTAEPFNGITVAWLKTTAHRLGIHLGTSFLEAEGRDFYNSFALATPRGEIAGRVRKAPPASVEAYFLRGGNDRHFIDTELGRIGVGICYENLLYERVAALYEASVDLVLAPVAAPTPTPTFPIRRKDAAAFDSMLKGSTAYYARTLGVPIAMANTCGPFVTPLPGWMPTQRTRFSGLSAIADSDGALKSQLGAEEGIAIAEVLLDPARKAKTPPRAYGRWALPVPWYMFLWPLTQKLGERAYRHSSSRPGRALAAANVACQSLLQPGHLQ